MMSMEEGELQPSAPSSEPSVMKAGMEQPGPAAKPSGGERSLFPLPFFACPAKKFGCSRPVKQRRDRIRRAVENCNEAIFGLNWLSGHRDCIPDGILVDGLQQLVMARVDGLVQCQKPSGAIDRPEAALRSLLKGASPYDLGISNETLAPYQYDLVSVPQDIKGCPDLVDVLDAHDRSFLEQERELMMKSASEVESSKLVPYWDPVLKHNKRAYYRLVRRLQQIGYFTYTLDPKCKIGVFFVWKSSRTRLRMITDARSANRLFKEPPGVSLMTGEGLGRIEVACGETVFSDPDAIDALSIYIGLSDVRDCFHRMRVPQWLAKYFAWEPVPAYLLGLEGAVLEGVTLGRYDMVWPCAGSLCQGFSWSLFFAQRANEHQASLTGPLRGAHLANDRGGPVVLNVGKIGTDDRYFYVYVDNLGVIGSDKEMVDLAMSELQDAFNGQGLELHGSEVTKDYVEALGCVLEGKEMRSRCNPRRLWRIHHGIRGLLRRGKCSGKVLEIIIGHCTFLGLICRPILSIFHAVYPFMRKHYTEVACLWKTVREELQAFMGVSFLLVQDWWRPWNPMVTSSDSSPVGYGICKSWWPRQLVAEVGRIQERSRFKRCDRHSARESALTAAGFHLHNNAWTLMDGKTLLALADEGWEVSSEFPEVPSGSLKRHLWSPVSWGKWKHDENIGVLEARTVYKAVKRLCMTRYGHGIRHVHLCDNLGVVLSVERCRSKNFKILKVIRCIAAFCLARNVHLSVRWIPSELNVSDEPSRVHDNADSKLLVDLVRADDFESFSPQASRAQTAHANTQTQAGCNTANRSSTQACKAASEQKPAVDSGIRDKTSREEDGGKNQGVDHKLPDTAPEGHQSDWFLSSKDRLRVGQHRQEKTAARGGGRDRQWEHFIRNEGRRKRKERSHFAKTAKKATAAESGSADAADLAREVAVGDSSRVFQGQGAIQHPLVRAAETGVGKESQLRLCRSRGSDACGALQPEVHSGGGSSLRRLRSGCLDGPETRIRSSRQPEDTQKLESNERLEKVVPISLEACLPFGCLVRPELADGGAWPCFQGLVQPAPGLNLPSTWVTTQIEEDGAGKAHSWGDWHLVNGDQLERDNRDFEGGGTRRKHLAGLGVASICASNVSSSQPRKADGLCLGLHLPGVSQDLQSVCCRAEGSGSAVSSPTFGPKHRQGNKVQRSGRGQKARAVAHAAECDEIREGRKIGCNVAEAESLNTSCVQERGAVHRGHYARPRLSKYPTSSLRRRNGFMADFFAGAGGVARAARALGFSTREWELLQGENHDLTKPAVQSKIKTDIQRGLVLAAMLAPPCSSFSPARDRARVIRTRDCPWGLPNLPLHEVHKLEVGNACFRAAIKIIKWLDKHGIPWILENPSTSKAWLLPPLVQLEQANHTQSIVTDFCQFGTRWRKRTKLLVGNMDPDDIARCCRLCHGPPGGCSRTHKKHFQLTGSARNGVPWTRIAQPYPPQLCHHLAYSLLCRYMMPTTT